MTAGYRYNADMTRSRLAILVPALATVVLAVTGCPKDEKPTTPTPVAAASATPGEMATATPMATPMATATATASAMTSAPFRVKYTWSGGLSIYHHYELAIDGADTAKVVFKVKPMRQDEVTVTDTLDADQVKELTGLFEMVKFDEVKTQPRKIRVMDIGQTLITREMGGAKHEVMENPAQQATTDIKPLRQWLDTRVRLYLEQSGVGPKRKPTPSPSPASSASPAPTAVK